MMLFFEQTYIFFLNPKRAFFVPFVFMEIFSCVHVMFLFISRLPFNYGQPGIYIFRHSDEK